jgi:hypothetical protein
MAREGVEMDSCAVRASATSKSEKRNLLFIFQVLLSEVKLAPCPVRTVLDLGGKQGE